MTKKKPAKKAGAKRDNGRFPKGTSGNPNGRPKGALNRDKLRELLADDATEILQSLLAKAKGGDTRIALALLDRLVPPLKAAEAPADLSAGLTGTRTEQSETILQGVASGEIAPSQAAQLLAALVSQARIVEVDDVVRRLEALERMRGGGA